MDNCQINPRIFSLTSFDGVSILSQPVYGRRRVRASTILGGWRRRLCFTGAQPFLGSLCFASLHEWFQRMPTRCGVAASETSKAVHMLAQIARVSLGLVFLVSGVSKLYSPIAAQTLLLHIAPIPEQMASFATALLSILECIAGGMLCANRMVITMSLILGAFLLASTMVGVLFVARPLPCGCFGDLIESRTDQWFLLRNFCLLGFVAFVLSQSKLKRGVAGT